jgi:hypothetical protein
LSYHSTHSLLTPPHGRWHYHAIPLQTLHDPLRLLNMP